MVVAVVIREYRPHNARSRLIAIFNLFPGFPLDGGRILRAFWWWKTGSMEEATRVASNIGQGFAVVLMILGGLQMFAGSLGGIWLIFIGMYLRGIAELSYQQVALSQSLAGTRTQDIMIKEVVTAPSELPVKRLISDYFLRYGYHGFPVATDGRILGIVSLANLKDIPDKEQITKTTRQIMTPVSREITIAPDTPLTDALKKMAKANVSRLLVMRGDQMMGMITQTGLLHFVEIKRAVEEHA